MKSLVLAFCFLFTVHLAAAGAEYNSKYNFSLQLGSLKINKEGSTPNRRGPRTKRSDDSADEVDTRIIGGTLAKPSQFPYQALLSYDSEPYCGASIIHKNWALTARHCILENETNTATVTVGTNRLDRFGGLIKPVDLFIPHPEYMYKSMEENNGLEFVVNDIGLIRLKDPITFSSKVLPVQLPSPELPNFSGVMGTIAGWGATKKEGSSELLQTAQVRLLPQLTCRRYWPYVRDMHLCTSVVERRSVCLGDSGGALVVNGRQYGIISTANDKCEWPKPNLYTDVSAYTWWIQAELGRFGDSVNYH